MKKVLLLLLSLVFIASMVEAKIVNDSVYQIVKTTIAPVIDGEQDGVWKALDWNMQRYYNVGDPPTETSGADSGMGLTGMHKAMWDADNIYILFYTVDDIIADIPTNAGWNQDAMEIYIDGNNDKTSESSLSGIQHQFTIPHMLIDQEVGHFYYAWGGIDSAGVEYKLRDVSDTEGFPGWMLEVKIPLANLGIDGGSATNQLIGWEMQQDESDDVSAGRASMSKWWCSSNNSWANGALWGNAILAGDRVVGVDSALVINKTSVAPVVDGTFDAAYKVSNPITTNLFRVGDPPGTDAADTDPMFGGFITVFPLWDADNMYLFLDVVDGIITEIPTNAGWNQDAVEIYIDGNNDHSEESSLSGIQHQFTIPHMLIDQEVSHFYYAWGGIDSTGVEYKLVNRDTRGNDGILTTEGSGWNLEAKIPLANLGIDGSGNDIPIGFEIQLDNSNDALTGRQGMEKWWNNSNNSWANAHLWGYAVLGGSGVKEKSAPVARSYSLDQNYPNPFNPSTIISYSIPKSENVKLTVYNLLGKQIAVLVNARQEAGQHTVTFNASNLASGMYFYKLESAGTVMAKKMMLLK